MQDLGSVYQQLLITHAQAPKQEKKDPSHVKSKPGRHRPLGYQIVSIAKDGNCLFNAVMNGMINLQLPIPSAWVTLNTWEQGQLMRKNLIKSCNSGYKVLSQYSCPGELLATRGDNQESFLEEMAHRITNGKYRQDSEREPMASKFNITICVYDALQVDGLLIKKWTPMEIELSQLYGTEYLPIMIF